MSVPEVDNRRRDVDRPEAAVDDDQQKRGRASRDGASNVDAGQTQITTCSVGYVLQTTTSCGLGLTGELASRIVFGSRSSAGGTEFGLPGPAEGSSMTGKRAAPIDRSGAQAGDATGATA